jgi:ABC-type sugar transport system permease subunit
MKRAMAKQAVLLPWAISTVVAAIVWSFMFESRAGIINCSMPKANVE